MTVKVKNLKWEMIKPECLSWSKIAWFSMSCKTPTFAPLENTRKNKKTPASPWFSSSFSFFLCFYLLWQVTTCFTVPPLSKHGVPYNQHGPPMSLCRVFEAALLAERGPPHSSLNSTPRSFLKCHIASTYKNNKRR